MEYIMARDEEKTLMDSVDLIKPASNDEYIGKIRKRLQEDASARQEREKRRRKVLVDQIKAHESQEVGLYAKNSDIQELCCCHAFLPCFQRYTAFMTSCLRPQAGKSFQEEIYICFYKSKLFTYTEGEANMKMVELFPLKVNPSTL